MSGTYLTFIYTSALLSTQFTHIFKNQLIFDFDSYPKKIYSKNNNFIFSDNVFPTVKFVILIFIMKKKSLQLYTSNWPWIKLGQLVNQKKRRFFIVRTGQYIGKRSQHTNRMNEWIDNYIIFWIGLRTRFKTLNVWFVYGNDDVTFEQNRRFICVCMVGLNCYIGRTNKYTCIIFNQNKLQTIFYYSVSSV